MGQIRLWGIRALGLSLVGMLLGSCADLANRAAKMHGLEVVSADECRHALHTKPCQTVEPKP
jgi:predicted kinase